MNTSARSCRPATGNSKNETRNSKKVKDGSAENSKEGDSRVGFCRFLQLNPEIFLEFRASSFELPKFAGGKSWPRRPIWHALDSSLRPPRRPPRPRARPRPRRRLHRGHRDQALHP